jgi:hypothetical protein
MKTVAIFPKKPNSKGIRTAYGDHEINNGNELASLMFKHFSMSDIGDNFDFDAAFESAEKIQFNNSDITLEFV